MCFSAEASFGVSAIILTIGAVSIKKSSNLPQRVLSCIPFVFGIQQFAEGILWLSLTHTGLVKWSITSTYVFLVFAQVVWPILVPLSVMLLEKDKKNKKVLKGLLAMGIILGSYLLYCLMYYQVQSDVSCNHIVYAVYYPIRFKYSGIFYFIPTVIPPIISSIKRLRLLGIVIFISHIITRIFYEDYLISVWCYFAAIISVVVLAVTIQLNNQSKPASAILST